MQVETDHSIVLELRKLAMPIAIAAAKKARCLPDDILNEACLLVMLRPQILHGPNPEASFLLVVANVRKRFQADGAFFDADREQGRQSVIGMPLISDADEFIDEAHRIEAITSLREEIEKLPKHERKVLRLHLNELSLKQIASVTGFPEGSVRTRYTQAKIELSKSSRLRRLTENLSVFPGVLWGKVRNLEARLGLPGKMAAAVLASGVLWVSLAALMGGEVNGDREGELSGRMVRPASAGLLESQGQVRRPLVGTTGAEAVVALDDSGLSGIEADGGRSASDVVGAGMTDEGESAAASKALLPVNREWRGQGADPPLESKVTYWPGTMIPLKKWTERNGRYHGVIWRYRADGTLHQTSEFEDHQPHGYVRSFDLTGENVTQWSRWEKGKVVEWSKK